MKRKRREKEEMEIGIEKEAEKGGEWLREVRDRKGGRGGGGGVMEIAKG